MALQTSASWTPENLAVSPYYWCGDRYDTAIGDWLPLKSTGAFIQASSGARPTNTTRINNHYALTFDGTKYIRGNQSTTNLTAATSWIVIQPTSVSTNQVVFAWDGGSPFYSHVCYISSSGDLVSAFTTNNAGTPVSTATTITYKSLKAGSVYAIICVYAENRHYLYVNGELIGSATYPTTLFSGSSHTPEVGGISLTPSFNGTLGNYGFCTYAVSGSELQSLRAYLNDWAGVSWASGQRVYGPKYITRTPTEIYGSSLGAHWGNTLNTSTWTDEKNLTTMTRNHGSPSIGTFSGSGGKYLIANGDTVYSAGDVGWVDGLTEITLFGCCNINSILSEAWGVIIGKQSTAIAFHLGLNGAQSRTVGAIGAAIDFDAATSNAPRSDISGGWNSVIFSWKAATGGVLYINGVAQTITMPVDAAYTSVPANNEELCIGGMRTPGIFGTPSARMYGGLAHVGIVTRASTSDEVQNLTRFLHYQAGI